MEIEQLAPHLWWWRTGHPDGQGWARDVSSYALVEGDDLVLFDPLVPADDEASFLGALDRDVSEHGRPKILVTVFWHARSSQEIFDRYEGTTVWAHQPSLDEVAKRAPVTNTFVHADELPGHVEALALHHMDEAAFWLPSHEAIVFGDTLLGYEDAVRHCPESWLREGGSLTTSKERVERVVNSKRPRLMLLTHGGPRQSSEASL